MQATKYQNTKWSTLAAAGVLLSGTVVCQVDAQTKDPLLDTLIRKGVLTEQEAKNIKAELPKESGSNIQMSWKDGINLQSADKKFKAKIGGRLHIDAASFSQDDDSETLVGDIPAAAEFRRARISLEGEIAYALPTFFKVEFDFAHAEVAAKDVFIGLGDIPYVGGFQVGHFKEPIGLELLTSSRFLTFIERALPVEAFAPERNTGAMFFNSAFNERMVWQFGAFSDTGDSGDAIPLDSDWRVDGRVAGTPWVSDDGRKLLHLGLSGSYIEPPGGSYSFRSTRPEAHLGPHFLTRTVPGDAEHVLLGGAEAALVFGPFSVQGEYFRNWVSLSGPGDSPSFDGFYVFGSWFITGESRAYKKTGSSGGSFDRLRPTHSFSLGEGGGVGAWELALRYSRANLNSEGINGGRMNDYTAGVNWYLNPNMKIQFNYTLANLERHVGSGSLEGNTHIFQTRFATDF
jgi:phosphate-selective porin OprO and OprP